MTIDKAKETGIIMSGDHPKKILNGIKTMSRRVIKPQPKVVHASCPNGTIETEQLFRSGKHPKCPYGQVGDRLWVRETFILEAPNGEPDDERECTPRYKADGVDISNWLDVESGDMGGKWRPSIFMPRWASRITLEITEVRVERVQEISYPDIYAEGLTEYMPTNNALTAGYYTVRFKQLWDSLNAKRGYSWESNPWVWVISFKLVNSG